MARGRGIARGRGWSDGGSDGAPMSHTDPTPASVPMALSPIANDAFVHLEIHFPIPGPPMQVTRLQFSWAPRNLGNLLPLPPLTDLLRFYMNESQDEDLAAETAAVEHFKLVCEGRRACHAAFELHHRLMAIFSGYENVMEGARVTTRVGGGRGVKVEKTKFLQFAALYAVVEGKHVVVDEKISTLSYSTVKMRKSMVPGEEEAEASVATRGKRLLSLLDPEEIDDEPSTVKRARVLDTLFSTGEKSADNGAGDNSERDSMEKAVKKLEVETKLCESRLRLMQAEERIRGQDRLRERVAEGRKTEARSRRLKEAKEVLKVLDDVAYIPKENVTEVRLLALDVIKTVLEEMKGKGEEAGNAV